MVKRLRLPSPALIVAIVALFVALGGTAVAAGVVPLAKRALVADNAKKVEGKTAAQVAKLAVGEAVNQAVSQASQAAQQPGPASTAAGLVSTKTAPDTIPANSGRIIVASCDAGKKVTGGGWTGLAIAFNSGPSNESGWTVTLFNPDDAPVNVSAYAICLG